MNILILCQRKCAKEEKNLVTGINAKIKEYISKEYGKKDYKYYWLCEGVKDINCADFHFNFSMFNYNTQNFVETYKNYFDIVMLNTCPVPFFTPYDFFGIHSILKENGNLLINAINNKKVKYETGYYMSNNSSLCPTPIAKEQIKLLFQLIVWENMEGEQTSFLIKTGLKENSYKPLITEMMNSNNSKQFSLMFNSLPVKLKNFMYYQTNKVNKSLFKKKSLNFAENIVKAYQSYDKNHKDIKNIKIYSVEPSKLTDEQKRSISESMQDCFHKFFDENYVKYSNGIWWLLEYKGEISSFLLLDSKYSIWNVCTPSNKRKKGFRNTTFP